MQAGSAFVKISADMSDFNKSVQSIPNRLSSLGGKFKKMGAAAAKGIGAASAAGAAAGAAIYGMATKAADATDRIDKMSQRLGMSRQGFQEWDFILSQSGVTIEQMQMGMKTLSQRMVESADGTGKGAEAFEKLGVSVKNADGSMKDQQVAFEEAVVALQGMESGVEKAALAQDLFGRSGQELLPLLNAQGGSIEDLKKKADELGIVLGDDAIDAGVQFTDTMDQLKRAFGGVASQIGVALMPIMQTLAEWLIANMPAIRSVFETVFGVIETIFGVFTDTVMGVISTVQTLATENAGRFGGIQETVTEKFGAVVAFLQGAWETISAFWDEYGATILAVATEIFTLISESITTYMNKVREVIEHVLGLVVPFVQEKLAVIQAFWAENGEQIMEAMRVAFDFVQNTIRLAVAGIEKALDIMKGVFDFVFPYIKTLIDTTLGVIMGIIKVFTGLLTGDFEKAGEGLKDIWTSLWDGMVSIVTNIAKKFYDAGRNIVNSIADGIKGAIGKVTDAIGNVAQKARDYLPFSPAKEGPLKDLDKLNFGGTIAASIKADTGEVEREMTRMLSVRASGIAGAGRTSGAPVINIDKMQVREEADIRKVARELYNMQVSASRGVGV